MALELTPPQRTEGDGMEKSETENLEKNLNLLSLNVNKGDTTSVKESSSEPHKYININTSRTLQGIGTAVKLTPKTVHKKKKEQNVFSNLKNKEPKFVPYEPYKAAVRPMVQKEKKINNHHVKKSLKDINNLICNNQSVVSESVLEADILNIKKNETSKSVNWESKYKAMEVEVQILREENEQLENQLKFQVQVNGELKNLLVAAVGEDMETKVHVLTEDKLHLARALLNSAKSLTTHQEQTEWLAGQCEVWRSKFLASSVMVEELARWKASLCQKVNETQDIIKKLLEDRRQIQDHLWKTHENLSLLRDNFDLHNKKNSLSSSNMIEISKENFKLSQILIIQLLGSVKKSENQDFYKCLPHQTQAEKLAEYMLANPYLLQLIGEPDAACNAVVGAAVALSGQLYLQNHPPRIECCPQCSGEIKLV